MLRIVFTPGRFERPGMLLPFCERRKGICPHGRNAVQGTGEFRQPGFRIIFVYVLPCIMEPPVSGCPGAPRQDAAQMLRLDYAGRAVLTAQKPGKDRAGISQAQGRIDRAGRVIIHCVMHHLHPPYLSCKLLFRERIADFPGAVPRAGRYQLPPG